MHERLRRFRLRTPPAALTRPELAPDEVEHALRVLRLAAGDRIEGLDGQGGAWELEIARADKRVLELRAVRELAREPRPGEPGAGVPWIEVAASLPKGSRSEELVGRLVQLGVARLVPLITARSAEQARAFGEGRRARLERIADEALKQSGRLWSLAIAEPCELDEVLADERAERLVLSPRAGERLFDWTAEAWRRGANWTAERPLCLLAGPEGGFTEEERGRVTARAARELWLGPHILRIETACEAAAATLVAGLARPQRSAQD